MPTTMKHILRFVPLLILYVLVMVLLGKPNLIGDESRYLQYTDNFLAGEYTDGGNPVLRNGPGYPIFLAPMRALGAPKWVMTLPNVFFLLLAVAFFYRILEMYVPRFAMLGAYIFGLYYPIWLFIPKMAPTTIGLFFLMGFTFHFLKAVRTDGASIRDILFAGLHMGGLIMVKFAFGYVLLVSLLLSAVAFVIWRKEWLKKNLLIFGFGFLLCIPYLGYTYALTGRVLYWGTNGGEQFYWMTSANEGEWGNWQSFSDLYGRKIPQLSEEHYEFYEEVKMLNWVEKNDAFLARGMEKLKAHPENYLQNVVANTFRLLFNYPNSFASQNLSAYFYILPNMTILVLIALAIYPGWVGRRHLPIEVLPPTLFILIYLGATTLMNAVPRYLAPVLPFVILWLTIIYGKIVSINIKQ